MKWFVYRDLLDRWHAMPPAGRSGTGTSTEWFPTWREAYAYADAMARSGR